MDSDGPSTSSSVTVHQNIKTQVINDCFDVIVSHRYLGERQLLKHQQHRDYRFTKCGPVVDLINTFNSSHINENVHQCRALKYVF